jgi:hypothetical protein
VVRRGCMGGLFGGCRTCHRNLRKVKRQMPDWTVVYFDEEASAKHKESTPRDAFEYEILG